MKKPNPPKIARKLRDGETLHFGYGPEGGQYYWLEPSARKVTEGAARRAISWPDVRAQTDTLFAETDPQSWKWKSM